MGKNCINLNQIWWFQNPEFDSLSYVLRKSDTGVSAKLVLIVANSCASWNSGFQPSNFRFPSPRLASPRNPSFTRSSWLPWVLTDGESWPITKVYLTLSFKSFWSLKVLEIRWVYSSKSILNTHARRKIKSTEMTKTKLLWQDINVDTSRNNCKSFLTNCFKFLKMRWTWKTFWRRKWSCCVLFFKSTCLAKICGPYM